MPAFRSESLEQLTRQITFAPPEMRRRHMDRAEDLYWQIDPDRSYPFAFIVFRITEYRPQHDADTMLVGRAVREDLLLFVDQISQTLDDNVDTLDPPPLTLVDVAAELNVSTKTIHRYRRAGLFARRLIFPDARRRLTFTRAAIDRFIASCADQITHAAQFTRIDDDTRRNIIHRARRITARVNVTPQRLARHLAKRARRSVEAIRHLIAQHDQSDPRFAIFPDRGAPLTVRQQRVIERAYRRGIPVARIAERFRKTRDAIYHAVNQRRAAALRRLDIAYVTYPTFDHRDADQIILAADASPHQTPADRLKAARAAGAAPANLLADLAAWFAAPPLEPDDERAAFVSYNYLKYRAKSFCDRLDRYHPRAADLDDIETDLRHADAVKQHITRAHLRHLVIVARRHLGPQIDTDHPILHAHIDQGRAVLAAAIDRFDVSQERRFAAYLTWALMRRFAQQPDHPAAAAPTHVAPPDPTFTASNEQLAAAIDALDPTERYILTQHFGLPFAGRTPIPRPLTDIARHLNITPAQARRIERRVLNRFKQHRREPS